MKWFHATNLNAFTAILKRGFDILMSKSSNRFGEGIYFSDKNDVEHYGEHVISADIKGRIMHMSIMEWANTENRLIRKHGIEYTKFIPDYVKDAGADALRIEYATGSELVVYNANIIKLVNPEQTNVVAMRKAI